MNRIERIERYLAEAQCRECDLDDVRALLRLAKESLRLEKSRWLGAGGNYDTTRLDWLKALAALEAPCDTN